MRRSQRLVLVRENTGSRWGATALAAFVGLALASVHWLGLLVAGALVALPQRSVVRGILAGAGFGILVLCVFFGQFLVAGTLAAVLELTPLQYLASGIGMLLPVFGALSRGVRPIGR